MSQAKCHRAQQHGRPEREVATQQAEEHAAKERLLTDGRRDRCDQQGEHQDTEAVRMLNEELAGVARNHVAAIQGRG